MHVKELASWPRGCILNGPCGVMARPSFLAAALRLSQPFILVHMTHRKVGAKNYTKKIRHGTKTPRYISAIFNFKLN